MRFGVLLVLLWLLVSGVWYYHWSDPSSEGVEVFVSRVIDGDTLELSDGVRVRLLGVNTPERGQLLYGSARDLLDSLVSNRSVLLVSSGSDRYGRLLGHVFVGGVHVNELLLADGFATLYYYDRDEYYVSLERAEASARSSSVGLWSRSSEYDCLELVELRYVEVPSRCSNTEMLVLRNVCSGGLVFTFKDDATHIYDASISGNGLYMQNFSCTFNDAGDSLYVWDDSGLLLFYRYK